MKLTATLVAFFAAAALVSAAPTMKRESDAEAIGKGICFLEAGLGVTSLSDFLDTELGGAISAAEEKLGVTALEDSIGLNSCEGETDGLSDVELISRGLCFLEKGSGITAGEDFLDETLGGAISSLEEQLGISQAEEKLGLSSC